MSLDAPAYVRSDELLSRIDSKLLIVDVQAKLMPLIPGRERVVANCRRLIEACRVLAVPVFATEQYPKGLGGTVPELAGPLRDAGVAVPEKLRFSSAECLDWTSVGEIPVGETEDAREKVIVAGIEAHVCVLQTVFDLLSSGYRVHVVTDAVDSRSPHDRETAFQRFRDHGATLTTTETVMFELCEMAGSPEFKEISRLVKEGAAGIE